MSTQKEMIWGCGWHTLTGLIGLGMLGLQGDALGTQGDGP